MYPVSGLSVSTGRLPAESPRLEPWFGNPGDTIQPSVFLAPLSVSPVLHSVRCWVTHIDLASSMSFFVAFVFVTLVDSEGEWQRYPTSAVTVMVVFVALLARCIWTTWEGREMFKGFLRHPLARLRTHKGGEISKHDDSRARRPANGSDNLDRFKSMEPTSSKQSGRFGVPAMWNFFIYTAVSLLSAPYHR